MNFTDEFNKIGEHEVRKRLAHGDYGDTRNPHYISAQEWLHSQEVAREEALNEETLSKSWSGKIGQ